MNINIQIFVLTLFFWINTQEFSGHCLVYNIGETQTISNELLNKMY